MLRLHIDLKNFLHSRFLSSVRAVILGIKHALDVAKAAVLITIIQGDTLSTFQIAFDIGNPG